MNDFLRPIYNFPFTPLSSLKKSSNTILDVSVVADWWKSSSPFVTSCSSPTSLKRFQIQEYDCSLGNCSEVSIAQMLSFLLQCWKASSNCFWKSLFSFFGFSNRTAQIEVQAGKGWIYSFHVWYISLTSSGLGFVFPKVRDVPNKTDLSED